MQVNGSGTAASEAVPAELAATFPDLGDIARTGRSAALTCQPARTANVGAGAGVAKPTYATMCQVRGVPNAIVAFARFPDLQSGPRNVLASRKLFQLSSDRLGDSSSDAGIDLIEHDRLACVLFLCGRLQDQHQPRSLATRGNASERLDRASVRTRDADNLYGG